MADTRTKLAALALTLVALASCGGGSTSSSEPTPSTTATAEAPPVDDTPAPKASPYDDYVTLAEQAGERVIARDDAAARAQLLCSGAAKDMFGGVPLTEFPTDLALVRAYCPDVEADYS